jgi:isoquinoline 1-oxidoreductase subunit beta
MPARLAHHKETDMSERKSRSDRITRRELLKATAVLVAGRVGTYELFAQAAVQRGTAINAWIAIARDGKVTLQCAHSEMGQGISTTFAAVIADELEADWERCEVVFSPAAEAYRHPIYNWQFTGNAESIRSYHGLIRKMGAAAREMLIAAAAHKLGVPASELIARKGRVLHPASKRTIGFGDIATEAAAQPVPAEPAVKPESEWRLVGAKRSLPRRDIPAKVMGTAEFGMDVRVPGMVYAAVQSAPTIGGMAANIDDGAARAMPGIIGVVPLGSAVAVVAEHYWQARLALEQLKVDWQPGPSVDVNDAGLEARYRAAVSGTGGWAQAEKRGDAVAALATAHRTIEAEYEAAWVSHAPMEPMNATVSVNGESVTVWAPIQGMQMTQVVLASALKLAPEKITVHRSYLGGGFGRRLLADFVLQAALCSEAVGRPVKVVWSREEDIKQDWFRPAFLLRSRAALRADGLPEAIHQRLVAPTILAPVSPTPVKPGMVDGLAVEGLVEHPYKVANVQVDYHMLQVPVSTMVLRTTGHGPNNFAFESFIDELAIQAGVNAYEYRRSLLADNPVARAVLDRAAQLAMWGQAAAGRHQGLAFADAFGSYLCQVIELSITEGAIKLHKITSVCDPGPVLDRINAVSMIEGGVVWGLSTALYSAITFAGGHTRERNFDRYRVVTLPDTPELVTDFLENRSKLGGLGEVGPVCIPAALGNALFAATGNRYRRLPLSRDGMFTVYGKLFR